MKNPVIYKITSPSNKIYIGQSWNWAKRKSVYKRLSCKDQVKIYNSLKKYGYDNHIIEIIEILPLNISQEDLNSKEIYWWEYYKNLGNKMLNIRYPGSNGKMSKESIKKAVQTRKLNGYTPSKETIEKIIETRKVNGYTHSEETKQKIGSKHKGKEISLEVRNKISSKLKGVSLLPEHRKKVAEASKRPCSNLKKIKIGIANKGENNGMFGKTGHLNTTSVKVINIITKEIFGSIAEAERNNNFKKGELVYRLNRAKENTTNFKYLKDVLY
jgi:group I intron endonuclease